MKALLFLALLAAGFFALNALGAHHDAAKCKADGGLFLTHDATCLEAERVLH